VVVLEVLEVIDAGSCQQAGMIQGDVAVGQRPGNLGQFRQPARQLHPALGFST
jgi:hypothetical protein